MFKKEIVHCTLMALACSSPLLAVGGALYATDFEDGATSSVALSAGGVRATLARAAQGSIDRYMGRPGQALVMQADFSAAGAGASAGISTGRLAMNNRESDLARLTLGVDIEVSDQRPIRVTALSYDAAGRCTGSRSAIWTPPVADSYYRYTLELDQSTPLQGVFDPLAPQVEFRFEISDADGAAPLARTPEHRMRLDNLSYTAPSFYVSAGGSDQADGRTPASAFATVQRAVDAAGPGDMVLLMNGTYTTSEAADLRGIPKEVVNQPVFRPWWSERSGSIATFAKAGKPAAWIVMRAYPGHQPRLYNKEGWAAVKMAVDAAYIEVRGLTLQGNGATLKHDAAMADSEIRVVDGWRYYGAAKYNGNGFLADGRATADPARRPHHLRFIGNTVYEMPAAGMAIIGTDHVTIAGNTVYDNVHFTRWGASGISFLRMVNFDESADHKMFIVGNRSFLNRTYVPWVRYENDADGRPLHNNEKYQLSDGNGIIVDVSRRIGAASEGNMDQEFTGRTLVANNLSYGNGGGIVVTTSPHVDIVGNTLYDNVQTESLAKRGWGDLFIGGPKPASHDITVINNIVQSVSARYTLALNEYNQRSPVLARNNLFYGAPYQQGDWPQFDNVSVDPRFVRPSLDPAKADFRLQQGSPARGVASKQPAWLLPLVDLDGARRAAAQPAAGAYN